MDLRAHIRDSGRKQAWVAERIGLSPSRLSLALSGKLLLPLDKLGPLASELGLPLQEVHDALMAVRQPG